MSLSPLLLLDSNDGDKVDLTSNWCETPCRSQKELREIYITDPCRDVIDTEARFWPTPEMIGA